MEMSDDRLGHVIWDALHAIAVNFPDGSADGLTQERLKGYYDFFHSLRYVLPHESWRQKWTVVTTSGNSTKLERDAFIGQMRDHKALSKWLFDVHLAISKLLKKSSKKGDGYASWYAKYAQFRRHGKGANSAVPLNKIGVEKILRLLDHQSRIRAIDEYLVHRIGAKYTRWTVARKRDARRFYLVDAAKYFWRKYYTEEARVNNFDEMNMNRKREAVMKAFEVGTKSLYRRTLNRVKNIPQRASEYLQFK
jgi:hypothetical protein